MAKKIKVSQIEEINHDEVYLNEDLIVTSAVGAITNSDFDAGKTYKTISHTVTENGETRNKTVKEALAEIFTKDNQPTVTQPSASLSTKYTVDGGAETSLTKDTYVEAGKTVVVKPAVSLNPGSYTYGPATGVTETGRIIMLCQNDGGGATIIESIQEGDAFTGRTLSDSDRLYVKADVSHSAGATPKTQLGNNATVAAIAAGTKSATASKEIKAFRPVFYGAPATDNSTALTSAIVRGLSGKSTSPAANGNTLTLSALANTKRLVVAIPRGAISNVSALLTTTMNLDISSEFVKTASGVQVADAAGQNAVAYDVWIYCPAAMNGDEVVAVTLKA